MKKGLLISLIITTIIVGGSFLSYMGSNNQEIKLRKQTEAQQNVCKSNFDKMFKTIAKMAQVPTKFMNDAKEAFKEIYPDLIAGRSDFLYSEINNKFIRKKFKEFSYLSVDPTTGQTIAAFIITLIVNVICSLIVIKNNVNVINLSKDFESGRFNSVFKK